MSALRETHERTTDLVSTVRHRSDLSSIHAPDCAAVIWGRELNTGFRSWMDGLIPTQLPEGRVVVHRDTARAALNAMMANTGIPPSPQREWFIEDMTGLAGTLADVMGAPYLRLRLEAVNDDACPKFHIDAVSARLICTYRGTGTQYGTLTGGNEPGDIHTVPTGSPILLRGRAWPGETDATLVHRSPPIEGTGETRLVLVVDPISDPDTAQ